MKPRSVLSLLLFLVMVAAISAWPSSDAGPRAGKYRIYAYGATNKPPIFLGWFQLEKDGTYKAYQPGDKELGEGTYEYDAEKKAVTWKTGPYKDQWDGKFEIDREGKTHKIRLKRTTIATNSTDS